MISPTVHELPHSGQPCTRDTFIDEWAPATCDVEQLLAAARRGEEPAWTAIVERFERVVHAVTRSYGLSPSDAQDVVQTTWLRLVEKGLSLREPGALPGWLATTARRECMRVKTASLRSQPVDPTEVPAPAIADTTIDDMIVADRDAALRRALASLPSRQRDVMTLLTREPEPSYHSVAAELRIPIGSVGPTRLRALQQLRRHGDVEGLHEPEQAV